MKRVITVWADDDWMNFSDKDLKLQLNSGELGIFHSARKNCYEGKPEKVKITIEKVLKK